MRGTILAILAILVLMVGYAKAQPQNMLDLFPATYSEGYRKAVEENLPLIVFVGREAHYVHGAVLCRVDSMQGYSVGEIVISAPENGKLYYVASCVSPKGISLPKKAMVDCDSGKCRFSYFPESNSPQYTTRAPVGHTHTCRNGHTWDHTSNPTHQCRECGSSQFVQDPTPRPVTVKSPITVRLNPTNSDCPPGRP